MSVSTAQKLLEQAQVIIGSNTIALIPFAKKTAPLKSDVTSPLYDRLHSQWDTLDSGGTNIEDAITNLASSTHGPAILISDGNETAGRAKEAVAYLKASQVSIFPLVREENQPDEFIGITQMHAPLIATLDKQTEIRVSLANFSSVPVSSVLTVRQGTKDIYSQSISLISGEEKAVTFPSDRAAPGLNELIATMRWKDSNGVNRESTHTIVLAGEKKEKVLLLNGSHDDDRFISRALQNEAYQVEAWSPGQQPPALTTYSAIILNNIPLQSLPYTASSVSEYVEKGGGLVMIGGSKSFGLGGYIGTPIETVLPVKLVPPQTTKKRLNVAVQLVLDKSKSMARASKLEFAQDAANQVVRNLKDEDLVGIIAFDTAPFRSITDDGAQ